MGIYILFVEDVLRLVGVIIKCVAAGGGGIEACPVIRFPVVAPGVPIPLDILLPLTPRPRWRRLRLQ